MIVGCNLEDGLEASGGIEVKGISLKIVDSKYWATIVRADMLVMSSSGNNWLGRLTFEID